MTSVIVGYMFLFIFRPFEVWPQLADLHLERLYMLFAVTVFVFARKNQGVAGPLHYYILALCGLVIVAPFYSPYPASTHLQVEEYLKYLVFYFMLLYGIRSREELEKVLLGFLAVMLVYEGKSLWEFLVNGRHTYRMGIVRMVGIDEAFSDPNTFAASVVYALPIAFLFLRYRSELYPRWLVWSGVGSLVAVSITSLVFTGSRSGQVTFLLLLLMEWFRSKQKLLLAAGFASLIVGVWTFMPAEYKGRFESIWNPQATDETAEESAQGRIEGIKDGYQLVQLRPMFGFGAGTFTDARGLVGELEGLAAHNLYGQVMGELGLVGSFLLLAIVLAIVKQCGRLRRGNRPVRGAPPNFNYLFAIAILEVLMLLLFQGNFGHNLYRYTWLWISAFLLVAVYFERRPSSETDLAAAPTDQTSLAR